MVKGHTHFARKKFGHKIAYCNKKETKTQTNVLLLNVNGILLRLVLFNTKKHPFPG